MTDKEKELYMKYCKYDKEPKEIILDLLEQLESLKDFKEIAENRVTDLNPIGLARANQLLSRQCHNLQAEIEKKDAIIDEMAGEIIRILYYCNGKVGNYKTPYIQESISKTQENIKEYFKKKVEDK